MCQLLWYILEHMKQEEMTCHTNQYHMFAAYLAHSPRGPAKRPASIKVQHYREGLACDGCMCNKPIYKPMERFSELGERT